jgi:Bcr/CflA subfamily drug resistance transporter
MQAVSPPYWILFFGTSLAQASEIVFSSGLLSLANELGLSTQVAQLCSAFYFLGITFGILLFGRMSDLFGRRKSLLVGIGIYSTTSFIIIFINNIYLLIFCRFFQALGVSSCSVISQAVARDCYRGRELAKIYSMIATIMCFTPTFASTIGGFIVEHSSWRYNVGLLMTLGTTLFLCYYRFLPETSGYSELDKTTSFLTIAKKMISDKLVILYALMSGCSIGMMASFIVEFPITFITHLGMTPSSYGLLNICISIAMFCGTLINLYLNKSKYSIKKIIFFGVLVSFIGGANLFIVSHLNIYINFANNILITLMFLSRMLQGIGHIIIMPYILSAALQNYQRVIGSASAIFNGIYSFVVALITFLTSYLHDDKHIYGFATLIFAVACINLVLFLRLKESI